MFHVPSTIEGMHRTPRKALTSGVAATLCVLLSAGMGFAVLDARASRSEASEKAQDYMPAVSYTAPPAPTKVAFLGDSYTFGTGLDGSKFNRWSTLVSKENGWLELNYGKGGTNYGTEASNTGAKPYSERLTDLIVSSPDIVIVSSAGNGLNQKQSLAIRYTFETLRDKLPDARIIALSPFYWAGDYPKHFEEFGDEIKAEVEAVGGEYIDIGHPLEDHPDYIANDGQHPNEAGYRLIANAVGEALN